MLLQVDHREESVWVRRIGRGLLVVRADLHGKLIAGMQQGIAHRLAVFVAKLRFWEQAEAQPADRPGPEGLRPAAVSAAEARPATATTP